jgi:hypothetical protein
MVQYVGPQAKMKQSVFVLMVDNIQTAIIYAKRTVLRTRYVQSRDLQKDVNVNGE